MKSVHNGLINMLLGSINRPKCEKFLIKSDGSFCDSVISSFLAQIASKVIVQLSRPRPPIICPLFFFFLSRKLCSIFTPAHTKYCHKHAQCSAVSTVLPMLSETRRGCCYTQRTEAKNRLIG